MATYLLLGTYLVSLSTLCVCSTGRLRLSCVWMAAFASKIEHISPAQPAGSSQHQRGGSSKCFTPLVFKMSSKQQTLPLSRLSAETFYFKGKWWLGDHPWFFFSFFFLYDKSSPLAQRENIVGMKLENRLWPRRQMNHNWAWNFSKPLVLTSGLINENQRKYMAGLTLCPEPMHAKRTYRVLCGEESS